MRKSTGRGYQFAGRRPIRTLPTYKEVRDAERLHISKRKARAIKHTWDPEPMESEEGDT